MYRKFLPILILLFMFGCTTLNSSTATTESEKVVITNQIALTNIVGENSIHSKANDLIISIEPVDARQFDGSLRQAEMSDGRHNAVISTMKGVTITADKTTSPVSNALREKLINKELSTSKVNTIISTILKDEDENTGYFGYTDQNIILGDYIEVNKANPFVVDNRYLSIVELIIQNNSNSHKNICEEEIFMTGGNNVYKNISSKELISQHRIGSVTHELLSKLLLNDCAVIPANSKVKTHVVFPYFYDNEELTFHYNSSGSLLNRKLSIERTSIEKEYIFTKFVTTSINSNGFKVTKNSNARTYEGMSSTRRQRYHFLSISNSIEYVGFKPFFLHDEIDLNSVEIVTIRIEGNSEIEIYRNQIKANDFKYGKIMVVEN